MTIEKEQHTIAGAACAHTQAQQRYTKWRHNTVIEKHRVDNMDARNAFREHSGPSGDRAFL